MNKKSLFNFIVCLTIYFGLLGCHYDKKHTHYYPNHSTNVILSHSSQWRDIQLTPDSKMTTFAVEVVCGQIPGWLGAYNNLVFAVPTELISADNLIPIEQLDMWNTAGPYAPGQGKISQGHITINKVDTKKIHMTIDSPDLNWDILKGQHTFRLGNQNKIPELNFYGAIK